MTDKEKIKQEIERRMNISIEQGYTYSAAQLKRVIDFIESLPEEPASEGLEIEIGKYTTNHLLKKRNHSTGVYHLTQKECDNIASHFAEWGRNHFEDKSEMVSKDLEKASERYCQEMNYMQPLDKEPSLEALTTMDAFIKGAEWQKQQIKEALQTEYEKGRFDMQQEMMKTLIGGEVVKDIHNQLSVKSEPLNNAFGDIKFGEKVKIIIVKNEQQ